jgi:hypothetical protein
MRRLFVLLAACGHSAAQPAPTTPAQPHSDATLTNVTRSCADAAHGIEGATRSVRDPDQGVAKILTRRCNDDTWPTTAIECFATMREGELGTCAHHLAERARESLFAILAGNEPTRAGLAVAHARLEMLQVGVPECDRFVTAVTAALACEQMPLDTRVQLGNETAQFWSLPTDRLGADDLKRISDVCGQSLLTLEQQATTVGC